MDDSGTQFPTNGRKFAARAKFVQQGVDHSSGFHARAGMNDHARGLVDDDEVLIGVEDFERDGFGLRVHRRWRRNFDCDGIAGFDTMGALGWRAIHAGVTVIEQRLDAGAAEVGKMRGQETIEPLAGFFGGNDELDGAREIAQDIGFFRGFVNRGAF